MESSIRMASCELLRIRIQRNSGHAILVYSHYADIFESKVQVLLVVVNIVLMEQMVCCHLVVYVGLDYSLVLDYWLC